MKIISKCLLGVFCCAHFNMALYAQNISIQQAEQAIDRKYAALDFYAVNQQIENGWCIKKYAKKKQVEF